MKQKVISLKGVWAGYGNNNVIEDINFSVKKGDFVGIIGPNGGGKSTLLKVILGLITPYKGEVKVMGLPPEEGREFVGWVPQESDMDRDFPIKVLDVVLMGRMGRKKLLRPYSKEDKNKALEALEMVGLQNIAQKPIGEISLGQRQRVYIARALAKDPEILLLDEPLASVDPNTSEVIYGLLKDLNESSAITIVMVTHDVGAVSSYVKSVGCLNRKLYYYDEKTLTQGMIDAAYHCPVDLIAHGVPHRVLPKINQEETKR
jgi:zinc transport system ATP-binding protein